MEQVLRADGRLHRIELDVGDAYGVNLTESGIIALAALEQRLTGAIDPTTMLTSPVRPRVEGLRRLPDGAWIVGYRLSGLPGPGARLRYREINSDTALAVARACGHAVEDNPGDSSGPVADPSVRGLSLVSRAAGVAHDMLQRDKKPTVAAVANRLGIHRNAIYRSPEAVELIRAMARIDRGDRIEHATARYCGDEDGSRRRDRRRVVRKSIEDDPRDDDP